MLIAARPYADEGRLRNGPSASKGASTFRFREPLQLRGPLGMPERDLERIARGKCCFQLAVQLQVETLLFRRLVVAGPSGALSAYVLLAGALLHVALQINRAVYIIASCQLCAGFLKSMRGAIGDDIDRATDDFRIVGYAPVGVSSTSAFETARSTVRAASSASASTFIERTAYTGNEKCGAPGTIWSCPDSRYFWTACILK
jgi:hypothetical protein